LYDLWVVVDNNIRLVVVAVVADNMLVAVAVVHLNRVLEAVGDNH
jgi:hypothetical protein